MSTATKKKILEEKIPYEEHLLSIKDKLPSIKYKDWYINQSYIPQEEDEDYDEFWEFQEKLCKRGFYIEDVYFSGFLYWHLNFWRTEITKKDEFGDSYEDYTQPTFRDNEWLISNGIAKAKYYQKGLAIGGSRRISKSVFISSFLSYNSSLDAHSQNLFVGLNGDDIGVTTKKISKGLDDIPEYFKWMRIREDWTKEVTLGVKDTKGTKKPFSQIFIRNIENGKKEEAIAGTKPRSFVIEEALFEDEVVYKDFKPILLKDCKVGDNIVDASGNLTKVLDKIDVGITDLYELTLKDGRKIKSCDNHIWKVVNKSGKIEELTTRELRTRMSPSNVFYLPYSKEVNSPHQSLLINPYILGYHLGDGDSKTGRFCSIDKEPIEEYKKQYKISNAKDNLHYRALGLVKDLRELGIYDNKHIPDTYFLGSPKQRKDLLAGLLDSDGGVTVNKNGSTRIIFTNKNFKLAEGVLVLSRSLGYGASINERKNYSYDKKTKERFQLGIVYTVEIFTKDPLFKIKRKNDKLVCGLKRQLDRSKCPIKSIKKIGQGQAFCLKVDNSDNLFLTSNYSVTHNCGKGSFLRGFKAAVPGFNTDQGWGCSPLLIFTGGDMEKYHDAKNVFMNPYSHNFLEYECLERKRDAFGRIRKHGLFLGNKYRQEAKYETTFGDYLGIEDKKSDLYNIPFWVSDEEYAEKILSDELERLKTNPDRMLYHKEVMYFPRTVDDIFLNVGSNMYNTKACVAQQQRLQDLGITGIPVELYSDGEKICWKESDKEYIREWPVETQSKDAPIMIYEMPEPNAPKFLYVAGVDPFTQTSSDNSDSLGAVYIYKRMHSLTGEGLRDSFVASYVARPDDQAEWEENARLLLMFYNAYALVENDEPSFCKYMVERGCAEMYLSPQPKLYKTLVVNGTQTRPYGLSRQSPQVREYLNGALKKYLDEVIHTEIDENGVIQREYRGVTKVLDHTLLSEIIGFAPGVNVDRQVAASLAIAMAKELDPLLGTVIGEESKDRADTINKAFNNLKKKTFSGGGSTFSMRSRKTFKR